MRLADRLLSLAGEGVELHAEAGQLRVRAPHGILTAEVRAEMAERKAEILALLSQYSPPSTVGLAAGTRSILPRPFDHPALSFGQERLWFLDRFEPDGRAAYNICGSIRLHGQLDLAALRQSLEEVVRRHEVLRTVIEEVEGRPVGRLCPPPSIDVPLIDLERLGSREEEVRQLADREARQPFDLDQCPLLRARVWRLHSQDHLLLLVLHHSVCDAWSIGVLIKEISTLYQSYHGGEPCPLADPPIQYSDFAAWQREQMQGGHLEEQVDYWRQLDDAPAVLDIPADHPLPAIRTARGAHHRFSLGSLEGAVRTLARREEVTPFQVMLAAFQALLFRYSGQEHFLLGSPIAGRHQETESLIGFFVNTLVLRADLHGNPSFRDLLRRVRETALAAYAHSEVPFERVVEELDPPRDRSRTPLVQVTFAEQRVPDVPNLPGLECDSVESYEVGAKVDLSLAVRYWKGGWEGHFEYNADLFEPERIERMAGHYCTLLATAIECPEELVSKLPLLTETEQEQFSAWNATCSRYPQYQSIAGRFGEQVSRAPEATAVVCGQDQLTYHQLNERADRLARILAARGVGRETVVGIFVERSLEMVVSLLGVLKAGGAYLPLDPNHPAPRLAFMLSDAECTMIVTQGHLRSKLPAFTGQILPMDGVGDLDAEPSVMLPERSDPTDLAYVMYTSGSTGQPKGVEVCQRSVLRLVCENPYADFGPDQTFLHFAPLAFDASTFEIWGPLLNGGQLILCPPRFGTLKELGQVISNHDVTTLWLTAGLFQQMVEHNLSDLAGLRQLLAGGDVLSAPHVRRFLEAVPGCRLINGYGPTEGTTFTCCYTVPRDEAVIGSIPIGKPIANTTVHVLDRHGERLPVGVPGELYIGGHGIARGYRGQPGLTSARFIPDPFGSPGSRLYRSGDLARYRPDGTLEFLGRMDRQLKVRGFRVEPEEVEIALAKHPAVREVRVDVQGDDGEKRLVAYIVPTVQGTESHLRRYVQEGLPRYMVPSAFVFLDHLPLTANGKVDIQALPREPVRNVSFVAAENPLHRQLAHLWAELLGTHPIGIDDDFFDLGGHSMTAIQLLAMIDGAFGKQLPISVLFEEPTIKHLAEALRTSITREDISPVVEIQSGDGIPFFFLHAELGGIGFYSRTLGRNLRPEQPFYVVQPPGLDGTPVPLTVEGIAAWQADAVQRVRPHGPYLIGGYCAGGYGAIELARQLRQQGEQVELLVVMHPQRPTGLRLGIILRDAVGRIGGALGLAGEYQRQIFFLLLYCKRRTQDWQQLSLRHWLQVLRRTPRMLRQPTLRSTLDKIDVAVLAEDPAAPFRWAARQYQPQRYPGRVTIFAGEAEPAAANWEGLADVVEVHTVPGGHDTFVEHLPAIAEHLQRCLDTVGSRVLQSRGSDTPSRS